jgi:foldase protein PrsA
MSNPSRLFSGILTAALGLALLAGCSNSNGGASIASVNGQNISKAELDTKLENGAASKQVLNTIVQGMLIDQYAKDNNVVISDADVAKKEDEIKSKYPAGQFEQILKAQNLTEKDVQDILRQQLVLEAAVAKNANISDKQIADYFAKNHTTLDKPEQIRAKHILVADPKTAATVEEQLKSGADFAALAKKYSTDPSSKDKGGELGFFQKGQMVPAFQAAAFTQKIGVVGPPVKSPFGYHIIVVEERKPAQIASLANSKAQIETTLKEQQEQTQIPAFLENLRNKAKIVVFDDRFAAAFPSPQPTVGAASGAAPAAPASAKP